MKWPWPWRKEDPRVEAELVEADQLRRAIEATEPILDEALRRSRESADRSKHARESLEQTLVRALRDGLSGDG